MGVGSDLKIGLLSLMLFILSVGFVIAMDLLVGIPLYVSFSNIVLPFESMVGEELIMLVILFLFSAVHAYRTNKKKRRGRSR